MSESSMVPPMPPMPPMPPVPPVSSGTDRVIYIQPAPAPPAKRGIFRSILIYVLASLIVFSVLMNFVMLSWFGALAEQSDDLREKYIAGNLTASHKVAVVSVAGMIAEGSGGTMSEGGNLGLVVAQLRRARQDKKVVGVVLEVSSPGGSVTASDIILHEIERTKKEGKRVVVWMGSLAASGGYYVSCKADRIYASPTTLTGSIGVIMSLFNVEGLSEKVGLRMEVVSCGKFKEMGSPFRQMSAEERAKFQAIADAAFTRFKDVIADGRSKTMTREAVDRLADGSIMTAQDALDGGLIDQIDFFETAVDYAKVGHADAAVVRYHRPGGLIGALLSSEAKAPREVSVRLDTPLTDLQPGLYYLWMPGLRAER